MKIALIGLGNPIVGDDGVGIKVVDFIQKTLSLPSSVEVIGDVSVGGIGLVELFKGYDKIILVDSIQTRNYQKGTVVELKPDDFASALHISDYHNMDFFTALEFCKQVHDDIPEDIIILGIEIINVMEFNDELSKELKSKFDEIVKQVYNVILQKTKEEIKTNVL
ncbi:MAG: hydrogenase maturation protease [Asgard group archaeon]|nr:hydrogenase maturation protease [Asgard group archaeon]